jgi:hypothetical protein
MADSLGSFLQFNVSPPLLHPSVLIIESDPTSIESFPAKLRGAMPDVLFEVCGSRDDGLSKLNAGAFHTVVSDAHFAIKDDFLLLKAVQSLSCPVPLLVSAKGERKDAEFLSRLIEHGAFDILRSSSQPSGIVRQALWLYRLRLTMHTRRQRLQSYRRRYHDAQEIRSERQNEILKRTIGDIEQTNLLCERTVQQLESSLRVLEDASRQLESRAMESAMRTLRLIEIGSSSVT